MILVCKNGMYWKWEFWIWVKESKNQKITLRKEAEGDQ